MKFVNFISVVLVAIFSLFMSSANAEPQGVGCVIINGVEVCSSEKKQQPADIVGCAIINAVEVCGSNKKTTKLPDYNLTTPVYHYNTQPVLQIINIGYVPVVVDARLADRAWDYISMTCPRYAMTSAATSFIADMSTVQFNGLSNESQMFLSACNAR